MTDPDTIFDRLKAGERVTLRFDWNGNVRDVEWDRRGHTTPVLLMHRVGSRRTSKKWPMNEDELATWLHNGRFSVVDKKSRKARKSRGGHIPLNVLRRRRDRLNDLVTEREREEEKARKPAVAPKGNRAVFDGDTLVLPGFSLFDSGGHAPNRKRNLAKHVGDNGTVYEVVANWPETRWWAYANKAGFRMSNNASTGSKEIADRWIEAVSAGNVTTAGRVQS